METGGGLVSGGVGRELSGTMAVSAVQGAGVEPGKQMELGSVNFVHSPIAKKDPNRGMTIEESVIHVKGENLGRVFVLAVDAPTFLLMLGSAKTTGVDCFTGYGANGWLERENLVVENRATFHKSLEDLEAAFEKAGDGVRTVLIQSGTLEFVETGLELLSQHFVSATDTILVCTSARPRTKPCPALDMAWTSVKHSSVGGFTSDTFLVGLVSPSVRSTERTHWRLGSSVVQRVVKGLQKVDKGGSDCAPPSLKASSPDEEGFLNPYLHCSGSELLSVFRLESVFSRTSGWVSRKIPS